MYRMVTLLLHLDGWPIRISGSSDHRKSCSELHQRI